jgi:hypothetical protein
LFLAQEERANCFARVRDSKGAPLRESRRRAGSDPPCAVRAQPASSERLRLLEAVEDALEVRCSFGLTLHSGMLDVLVDETLDLEQTFS